MIISAVQSCAAGGVEGHSAALGTSNSLYLALAFDDVPCALRPGDKVLHLSVQPYWVQHWAK